MKPSTLIASKNGWAKPMSAKVLFVFAGVVFVSGVLSVDVKVFDTGSDLVKLSRTRNK